jgi:paraquat-inducible protein A
VVPSHDESALIACPRCGALQAEPPVSGTSGFALFCCLCRSELARGHGRDRDAALACAAATFLLLIPANLLPFLTTTVLNASRGSRLGSASIIMWNDGWPWLGLAILLFVVVFPFFRFGLLTIVLAALRLGRRPPWLGRAFRHANSLGVWAMPDVFLLGLAVAYSRLSATVTVTLGAGAVCFILAGILTLFTRATLDKAAIWRDIAPQPGLPGAGDGAVSCPSCDLVLAVAHDGRRCPRCGAIAHARRPEAVGRATALTVAGLILYVPANIYPIATLPIGLKPTSYTVIAGIRDLMAAGLFGLALLVFCASFLIPFLKLAGITWCIASVLRRSNRGLAFKTRVYQVVEEIGRWSMVDPFVIACSVPVLQYNELVTGRAEPGASAFAAVVVVTIIAARCFDPRLMWDAAQGGTRAVLAGSRTGPIGGGRIA